MWIRSYDGELLLNTDAVEEFIVEKEKKNLYCIKAVVNRGYCLLQRHMTYNAAMELLSRIHCAILDGVVCLPLSPDFTLNAN